MTRTAATLLTLLFLAILLTSSIAPQAHAAPMATLLSGPETGVFEATPDLARVVFNRSQGFNGPSQVTSVPIGGGSAPIQIDSLLPPGGGIEQSYVRFTPDGRFVLYRGEGSIASSGFHYDLFVTPADGSAPARMLNDPALFVAGYPYNYGNDIGFQVLADSRRVIFRAGISQEGVRSLYAAIFADAAGVTLQRLVRGDAPVGSAGFLLAIEGANFVPGTSVEWNGQIRPATFVSDRRINVSIDAADLAAAGSIAVRAVTPANDRSNVVFFFVTPSGDPLANTSVYLPLTQR